MAPVSWPPIDPIPAPLVPHEATVGHEWVDYNDHMTESAYLLVIGDSSDRFFRFVGVNEAYRASGRSLFTVETHLRNLREVDLGERLRLTLQVLASDSKRLHVAHEIFNGAGVQVATAEQMLLHVDTVAGRSSQFPDELAARLREIERAHAGLGVPGYVGHVMSIPGR